MICMLFIRVLFILMYDSPHLKHEKIHEIIYIHHYYTFLHPTLSIKFSISIWREICFVRFRGVSPMVRNFDVYTCVLYIV